MELDGQGAKRQCKNGNRRLDRSQDLDFFRCRFDGERRGVIVRGQRRVNEVVFLGVCVPEQGGGFALVGPV